MKSGGHVFIMKYDGTSFIFIDEMGEERKNVIPFPVNQHILDVDFKTKFTSYELAEYHQLERLKQDTKPFITFSE